MKDGIEMKCHSCEWAWVYTGEKKEGGFCTCPNCMKKTPIKEEK